MTIRWPWLQKIQAPCFVYLAGKLAVISASEASENIITNFTSQAPYVIRIKHQKTGGSENPAFLIPALRNVNILLHQQAIQTKHFDGECKLDIGCFPIPQSSSYISP